MHLPLRHPDLRYSYLDIGVNASETRRSHDGALLGRFFRLHRDSGK